MNDRVPVPSLGAVNFPQLTDKNHIQFLKNTKQILDYLVSQHQASTSQSSTSSTDATLLASLTARVSALEDYLSAIGQSSGTSVQASAGEDLGAFVVVAEGGAGLVHNDLSNPAHLDRAVGFTTASAATGQAVPLAVTGDIVENLAWGLTAGDLVWASDTTPGAISGSPGTASFAVRVGIAISDTKIFVMIGEPVLPKVTSFNTRTGDVTPEQADYDAFFLTPAEGAAAFDAIGAAATALSDAIAYADATFLTPAAGAAAFDAIGAAATALTNATTYADATFLTPAAAAAAFDAIGAAAIALTNAITYADATFQPVDADLSAIAALVTQAYGRSLLTLADEAAGRAALGFNSGTLVQGCIAVLGSTPSPIGSTETVVIQTPTIPGGALQATSTFRITASGDATGTFPTAKARLRLGAAGDITDTLICETAAQGVANGTGWFIDALVTVRSIGASGDVFGAILLNGNAASPSDQTTAATEDTTGDLILSLTLQGGGVSPALTPVLGMIECAKP